MPEPKALALPRPARLKEVPEGATPPKPTTPLPEIIAGFGNLRDVADYANGLIQKRAAYLFLLRAISPHVPMQLGVEDDQCDSIKVQDGNDTILVAPIVASRVWDELQERIRQLDAEIGGQKTPFSEYMETSKKASPGKRATRRSKSRS